jgi:hypothetical protein
MLLVILNTFTLCTDGLVEEGSSFGNVITHLNYFFSIVFIVEMCFKVTGLGPAGYVSDLFNIADGLITCLSIVELVIEISSPSPNGEAQGGGALKSVSAFRTLRIFRTFRVFRMTRILRSMRYMKVIIDVMNNSIDQFAYISLIMIIFIVIFALVGMQLFGAKFYFPEPNTVRANFDSFVHAFITVFQIMTLENWQEILIIGKRSDVIEGVVVGYLVLWIFIGNYIFLNLFLAILLDGFTSPSAYIIFHENISETEEIKILEESKLRQLKKRKQKYKERIKYKLNFQLPGQTFGIDQPMHISESKAGDQEDA